MFNTVRKKTVQELNNLVIVSDTNGFVHILVLY